MTKNRSLTVLVVVLAVAVVVTGGLMASNMGFKLNRTLIAGSDASSKSGTQLVSLPYNRQVDIDTARDLFEDISNYGTVQNIQDFLTATDTYQIYEKAALDFPLIAGKGVVVKMGSNAAYIIVGSHDPSASVQLEKGGTGASKSGNNLFAPPYHATSATARALFEELLPNVQNVQKFLIGTDTFQIYEKAALDFNINPGEAYFVKMGVSVVYEPSHY